MEGQLGLLKVELESSLRDLAEKTAEVKREEVQYESQYYRLKVFREQINAVLNAISTKLK